jgi:hypothetical protein
MPDPNDPTAPAGPDPIEPHDLNVALIRALGLDDDKVAGFRLEVTAGSFPVLQVWWLPPIDQGALTDAWVSPLRQAAADASYIMLPGGDAEAPPVRLRPIIEGNVAAELYQLLHAVVDILNGASCTPELRDQLTAQARVAAQGYMDAATAKPWGDQ